jgi:hypothetical protein
MGEPLKLSVSRHQPFTVGDFCSQREITQWQRLMKALDSPPMKRWGG